MKNLIHFTLCFALFVPFRNEEITKFVSRNVQWLPEVIS